MPESILLEVPHHEQEWRLAEWRRARYGYLLALHVLLLCAAGRTPTASATVLFCSRSSVSRIVNAYPAPPLDALGAPPFPQAGWLSASLARSLRALRQKAPAADGGCRPRWRCATLAVHLHLQRGLAVSASTLRRWRPPLGWVWKRAPWVARDDDPQRLEQLARIRHVWATLGTRAILLFADDLDIHLLPQVG